MLQCLCNVAEFSPGFVLLLALGERLAEVGVGAEVERRLVLLVLQREGGPVGS